MPTYEYRCPDCSAEFEKFQRMSDEPVAECPKCGAASRRKISGGAGLLFKGDGFYITDYRSESYKKAAESDKGGSSESKPSEAKSADKGSGSGPSESKSAPASPSKPSKSE